MSIDNISWFMNLILVIGWLNHHNDDFILEPGLLVNDPRLSDSII